MGEVAGVQMESKEFESHQVHQNISLTQTSPPFSHSSIIPAYGAGSHGCCQPEHCLLASLRLQ